MENKNMLDKVTPPPLPNSGMVNNHSAEANYGIMDWFKKGLRNYANFSGRARRKEYWYFVLVQMGLVIIAMILDAIIFNSEIGLFYIVVALGLFLPGLAVTIRRLGVMDIIHAGVVSNAIYCLYLQGIKAMNQKTALFVMINTPRRMDAS